MYKTIMAASAALVCTFGIAAAADLGGYQRGSLKDEPVAAFFPSWAGLYVGGSVGYGWGDIKDGFTECYNCYLEREVKSGGCCESGNDSDHAHGLVYGALLGYNFQRGNIVFGPEISFNGSNIDGHTFDSFAKHELDWYGTAVGRLGYAYGSTLFYGFGGAAWGKVESTDAEGLLKIDDTRVGWTAGIGIERAFSDRLSGRIEYAHIDLGSKSASAGFYDDCFTIKEKVDFDFDVVKVGLTYKLTGGEHPIEPLK